MTVLVLGGTPARSTAVHVPGVTICTWLATSASVTSTSLLRVHEYWCRLVRSSGSKTTVRFFVPETNSL